MRSLITLKALTYAPSGGIVAAATTSLPESPAEFATGTTAFCWLRDATFTLLALLTAGYAEEASRLARMAPAAVAGDPSKLQIMYGIGGERRLSEWEVAWLSGYENSKPVRIGNAAHAQFQLDVYGEVIEAMYHSRTGDLNPSADGWRRSSGRLVCFVEKTWNEPDEGIWEVRGPRRDFTHSKVMAWVALDRAIKNRGAVQPEGPSRSLAEGSRRNPRTGLPRRVRSEAQLVRAVLCAKELDASLLMIPLVGFLPPTDERVAGTVAAIEKHLMRDGFVMRYDTSKGNDGLPPGEGAFLPCSFWLADNYALLGQHDKARELFDRLAGLCNDVGLLSEEYDPKTKCLVGNFPQAFSHVGLVNTALNLSQPVHRAHSSAEGCVSC